MNDTLRRYLLSSVITFVTAFVLALGAQLATGAITPESLTTSAIVGVIYIAGRAACKALIESLAGTTGDKQLG